MHQLIREPVGFQAARRNAVDEQLMLRETWAAIWRANTLGSMLTLPKDDRPLFHRPSTGARRWILSSFRAVTGLGYDAAPLRVLNELPDQGIEALVDLTMLIEQKGEMARLRVQCKLRRFEAEVWEPSNAEGFLWATHARGDERCVCEQAAWSDWVAADGHAVATFFHDLLNAFGHVAYQKLIDAAVRTRFPVRQLKLLLQLHQAAMRVELKGVAGDALREQCVCDHAPPAAAGGNASGGPCGRP